MLSPIHTRKHMVDLAPASVAAGAVVNSSVAIAVDAPVNTSAWEVEVGSVIKAIYLEVWMSGVTANLGGSVCIYKRPAGAGAITAAEMTATMNTFDNKANIFEFHKGLMPTGGNLVPMFRHWVKIPKGKQRMALGDIISVAFTGVGTTVNFCGLFIFKEYQ